MSVSFKARPTARALMPGMETRVSLITLGVDDLARSRAFYEALGWRSNAEPDADIVFFQAGGSIVALWGRENLAADTGVDADGGGGFDGIVLAHVVGSEDEVDRVVAEAEAAGARVTDRPAATFWGGYSGKFTDPDGHAWEIARNPNWTLADDGSVSLG
jgi:predicted lactoylglutathione lyase